MMPNTPLPPERGLGIIFLATQGGLKLTNQIAAFGSLAVGLRLANQRAAFCSPASSRFLPLFSPTEYTHTYLK